MKITWELILAISGGMVVLYNATNALLKFVSPLKKIKDKVDNHEQRLIKDYNRINEIEKSNNMICKCMFALLDHEITGNSVEKLKSTRADLQNYLIGR